MVHSLLSSCMAYWEIAEHTGKLQILLLVCMPNYMQWWALLPTLACIAYWWHGLPRPTVRLYGLPSGMLYSLLADMLHSPLAGCTAYL